MDWRMPDIMPLEAGLAEEATVVGVPDAGVPGAAAGEAAKTLDE